MKTEDDKQSAEVHISCSLCDNLNGWYNDEKAAREVLIKHLKKAHPDVYDPMTLEMLKAKE